MSSPSRLVEHVAYYIFYVRWNGNPGRYHTVKLEIRLVFNVLQVEISCVTLENASRRVSIKEGVSQQILTILIHRLIRGLVCRFSWLSNRRTCWLTFAALRICRRSAIQV
jgi:hypothetical protein